MSLTREDIGDIIEAKLRKAKLLPTLITPESCAPGCGPLGCVLQPAVKNMSHMAYKARVWENPDWPGRRCLRNKLRYDEARRLKRSRFYLRSSRP